MAFFAFLLFLLFLLVLAAFAVDWYLLRIKSDKSSPPQPSATQSVSTLPPQTKREMDTFLQEIASEKAQTDAVVATAMKQHEHELEQRFAEKGKLKERLSQFARVHELDKALIALWKVSKTTLLGQTEVTLKNGTN